MQLQKGVGSNSFRLTELYYFLISLMLTDKIEELYLLLKIQVKYQNLNIGIKQPQATIFFDLPINKIPLFHIHNYHYALPIHDISR